MLHPPRLVKTFHLGITWPAADKPTNASASRSVFIFLTARTVLGNDTKFQFLNNKRLQVVAHALREEVLALSQFLVIVDNKKKRQVANSPGGKVKRLSGARALNATTLKHRNQEKHSRRNCVNTRTKARRTLLP